MRLISLLILIISFFFASCSSYCQNCSKKLDRNTNSFLFIYQNKFDSLNYLIERIHREKDTIYTFSFSLNMSNAKYDKSTILKNISSLENYKDSLFQLKKDTLIYFSDNKISYKSGGEFINTEAPYLKENESDFLNQTLFRLNENLENGCNYYTFKQIDIFSSKQQVSYTYLKGYWVVSYKFDKKHEYIDVGFFPLPEN